MNEKNLEDFYRWYYNSEDVPRLNQSDLYIAIMSWQASRSTLVIEVPSFFSDRYGEDMIYSSDMEAKLTEVGLKYK